MLTYSKLLKIFHFYSDKIGAPSQIACSAGITETIAEIAKVHCCLIFNNYLTLMVHSVH
jgi:hypothetical protein